jgi:hypothetical protein
VLTNINDETEHGVPPAIRAARLRHNRTPSEVRRGTVLARSWHGQGHGGGTVVSPYLSASGTRN